MSLRERALKVEADRAKVQREGDERSKNCEKLRYVILNFLVFMQDAFFTFLKNLVTRPGFGLKQTTLVLIFMGQGN